ncbi:MAG: aminotransferase class V-fold PLP-dependent enzyme [Ignavibacteria bacterium]|nr:aminotransferase class V-fold PLP-dependent enzyme [Ignavibacteria bacterium]
MTGKIYFTVGPTELYPEVKSFYKSAFEKKIFSISHRSIEFEEIFKTTVRNLKKLLNIPKDYYVFFYSSATECMERIIQNLVREKSFHYVNGFFAQRFYEISLKYKKSPEKVCSSFGEGTKFENISIPNTTELICIILNETSTGVALNIEDVKKLKQKYPDILIALDLVSAIPYYKIDYKYIDCSFFSVQKGFGMPPGLGVLILNEKCIKKAENLYNDGISIGSYNNFLKWKENYLKNQTTVTPNIPAIFVLGKICETLIRYGNEKIREETNNKAKLIYDYFENHNFIKPFVKNRYFRSKTTISLETNIDSEKIIKELARQGLIISNGYKIFKGKQIRIGNFPMHKTKDVKTLIQKFSLFNSNNKFGII